MQTCSGSRAAPRGCKLSVEKETIPFTAKTRELAEQLLILEASGPLQASVDGDYDSGFRVCDRLRPALCSLAGASSFQAILSRALTLTKTEFPRLAPAKLQKYGCLEGLAEIDPPLNAEEANTGEVILIGNLVELLCTLVGETLALRLLQGVWPDLTFTAASSEKDVNA